jgi:hypothetical protein
MFVAVFAGDSPRTAAIAAVFHSFAVTIAANASGERVHFVAFLASGDEFGWWNGIESGIEKEFGSRLADIVARFAVHGTSFWVALGVSHSLPTLYYIPKIGV